VIRMRRSSVHRFFLKNTMMIVVFINGLAVIGFLHQVDRHLSQFASYQGLHHLQILPRLGEDFVLTVLISEFGTLFSVLLLMFFYEQPIRRYINLDGAHREVPTALREIARRRILNEPYFVGLMFGFFWLAGTILITAMLLQMGADHLMIRLNIADLIHTFAIGLTVGMALMITVAQWLHAPYFFPEGGLLKVPGVRRIGLRIRFGVLLVAISILPLMSIIRMQYRISNTNLPPDLRFTILSDAIWFIVPFSISVSILLTILAASHVTGAVNSILKVLRRVAGGIYNGRVRVTTNDELGYAGDVINEMTAGLQERDRMQQSLNLAMEVQRSLLPERSPDTDALDIAGISLYCDETGGDYFDYIWLPGEKANRLGVVLADVSGHGISSALLMASTRACLRQRAETGGDLAAILFDVNRQLARDVMATGSFMTLILMCFEPNTGSIRWVRAGHEPAVLYDPGSGSIEELRGAGVALGIDENMVFQENFREGLLPGQILLLSTDGLWEAQNLRGEMLGREPVYRVLRQCGDCSAQEILDRIIETLVRFHEGAEPEDDVTLTVIKLTDRFGRRTDREGNGENFS
jgi:sigma-B regulation protein RsbU (phosphoserine phosphatase)